jgi:SAM-dependent methyltransferase
MKESLKFYNEFDEKLIKDYVMGNKRVESAIRDLSVFIPKSSENILDIGCGLGWSSNEFANHFNTSKVKGIDLSPILIEKANQLFVRENLSYDVYDITKQLPNQKYDAIIMIDVYEHIPKKEILKFHGSLNHLLNPQGRLILACPSKYHQSWLSLNKPEGLQPIDEDVDFQTINDLAKDINGEVIYFEYKNIWRNYDYLYAVIEIEPIYHSDREIKLSKKIVLELKPDRVKRVKEKLKYKFDFTNKKKIQNRFKNRIKIFLKYFFN